MKIDDILALVEPDELVEALWIRLIPLIQGPRIDALPPAAADFARVYEWVSEVGSGGHRLYFDRDAAGAAPLMLAGLERIGPPAAADLFRRALAVFPDGTPPPDLADRLAWLEANDATATAALDALDEPWRALRAEIIDALVDHARAQREELGILDGYPSGLKALDLPAEIELDQVIDIDPADRCAAAADAIQERLQAGAALADLTASQRQLHLAYATLANLIQGGRASLAEIESDLLPIADGLTAAAELLDEPLDGLVRTIGASLADGADADANDAADAAEDRLREKITPVLETLAAFADEHPDEIPPPAPDPFLIVTVAAFRLTIRETARTGAAATFLDAWDVLDEVSCGGYGGYLFCGAGDRHAEATAALRALGVDAVADQLERALAAFGEPVATATAARRAQIDALDAAAEASVLELAETFQNERTALVEALAAFVTAERSALGL